RLLYFYNDRTYARQSFEDSFALGFDLLRHFRVGGAQFHRDAHRPVFCCNVLYQAKGDDVPAIAWILDLLQSIFDLVLGNHCFRATIYGETVEVPSSRFWHLELGIFWGFGVWDLEFSLPASVLYPP